MTPRSWPMLSLLRDEPDQVPRLAIFRDQHPGVLISELGGRYWDRTSDLLGVNEALSR